MLASSPAVPVDFYAVAATVIPVLFIGLAIEAKALDVKVKDVDRMIVTVILQCIAAIGEVAALKVLVTHHPTELAQDLVIVAMIMLGFVVVAAPSIPQSWPRKWQTVTAALPGAVFALAVYFALSR